MSGNEITKLKMIVWSIGVRLQELRKMMTLINGRSRRHFRKADYLMNNEGNTGDKIQFVIECGDLLPTCSLLFRIFTSVSSH